MFITAVQFVLYFYKLIFLINVVLAVAVVVSSEKGKILRNVGLLKREENRRTRRKTLGVRTRTNNKLNPLMTPGARFSKDPVT